MKKQISIPKAVRIVFKQMPDKFHVNKFSNAVRMCAESMHTTDGYITRELRKAREDGLLNYRYNNAEFMYEKVKGEGVQANIFMFL